MYVAIGNLQSTCGLHAVYMRSTCGLHAVYMWSTCGLHVVCMWSTCGLCNPCLCSSLIYDYTMLTCTCGATPCLYYVHVGLHHACIMYMSRVHALHVLFTIRTCLQALLLVAVCVGPTWFDRRTWQSRTTRSYCKSTPLSDFFSVVLYPPPSYHVYRVDLVSEDNLEATEKG